MPTLTIALSKGRILDETLPLLARGGHRAGRGSGDVAQAHPRHQPRRRVARHRCAPPTCRPTCSYGAADVGVAGKDVLLEHGGEGLYQPLDLGIGRCRMVVATRRGYDWKGTVQRGARIRVATNT